MKRTVVTARITNWKANVLGVPKRKDEPSFICADPNPSVEATPIIVAKTANVSISFPNGPAINFLPNKGISVALIKPGASL